MVPGKRQELGERVGLETHRAGCQGIDWDIWLLALRLVLF